MADHVTGDEGIIAVHRCPWCSAPLPSATLEQCPECGAALAGPDAAEPHLPGVTTLDAEAILRAKAAVARPRSRLISFFTGDLDAETDSAAGPPSQESLAPPSEAVRREMLRLELAARLAELESEAADLGTLLEELPPLDVDAPAAGAATLDAPVADPQADDAVGAAPAPAAAEPAPAAVEPDRSAG
jgi:hypothetical protein